MGLLGKLFGGGVEVSVKLNAEQVPLGGLLSGTVKLQGGKKDLTLTNLSVRLIYTKVVVKKDSPMPEIDASVLLNHTLAVNQALPAERESSYDFKLEIPNGMQPSSEHISYTVQAHADIPGVKDPSADVKFKVVETAAVGDSQMTLEELYTRWPALRGGDDEALRDALWNMKSAHYDKVDLIIAEPILADFVKNGSSRVQSVALDTWGIIINERVRKEHVKLLEELSQRADLESSMKRQVAETTVSFADEGALPLLKSMVKSSDEEFREFAAYYLSYASRKDRIKNTKEILLSLTQDPNAKVRAAAFAGLVRYVSDRNILELVVKQIDTDPSVEVQAEAIEDLPSYYTDNPEVIMATLLKHVQSRHSEVKVKIASRLYNLPAAEVERVAPMVQRLLSDPDKEVRRSMAWSFCNMEHFPQLAGLARECAEKDPDEDVRYEALSGLGGLMDAESLVQYYSQRLQSDSSERMQFAAMSGCRNRHKDAPARAMLEQLAKSSYQNVADAAKSALSY